MSDNPVLDTMIRNPKRLATLQRLLILDSDPEPAFDRLTRLASDLLNTPISLVALVDADRQFFKSHVGLPEPWATIRQTPLSHSFCQYVVESGEPLIVEDAQESSLLQNNFAISELNAIAYAGMPLFLSDGVILGSFCVIDHSPRQWSDREIRILRDLSASVATEVELRFSVQEYQRVYEQMRRERVQSQSILDNADAIIYVKDLQGRYLMINRAFEQLFNINKEMILGKTDEDFFPPQVAVVLREADRRVLRTKQTTTIEEKIPVQDKYYSYLSVKFPLFGESGELYALCGISTDISARVETEQRLRQALEHEKEIGLLRTRLTAMISHEFRTPLSVILSSAGLLEHYWDNLTDERRRKRIEQINSQVYRLLDMLDDVLALGKLESEFATLNLEKIEVEVLCEETIELVKLTNQGRLFVYQVQGVPHTIEADPNILRQAILNVITNAVKYSPSETAVDFTVHFREHDVSLLVRDRGIGIPAKDQSRLFDSFYRASNVGAVEGTGLGLSIVMRAIKAHGGTIAIESTERVGTTIEMCIPYKPPEAPSTQAPIPLLSSDPPI